jgi:hypothetical protein
MFTSEIPASLIEAARTNVADATNLLARKLSGYPCGHECPHIRNQ